MLQKYVFEKKIVADKKLKVQQKRESESIKKDQLRIKQAKKNEIIANQIRMKSLEALELQENDLVSSYGRKRLQTFLIKSEQ